MPIPLKAGCDLGWRFPGRTVLGYTLYVAGEEIQARATVSVIEVIPPDFPTDRGYYETAPDGSVSLPVGFRGTIVWDDPETGERAYETIDLGPRGPIGPGGGAGSTANGLVASLMDRILTTEPFMELLPGGFTFGPPDESANDPVEDPDTGEFHLRNYGVLTWISEQTDRVTHRREDDIPRGGPADAGYRTFLEVALVGEVARDGEDSETLERAYEVWKEYFNARMEPLLIRRREFRYLFNGDRTVDVGDTPPSPTGYNTVVIRWGVEIITNKAETPS